MKLYITVPEKPSVRLALLVMLQSEKMEPLYLTPDQINDLEKVLARFDTCDELQDH